MFQAAREHRLEEISNLMETHSTGEAHLNVRDDRSESFAQLLKDLRDETTLLMRQEIALAKTEMMEKIVRILRNFGYVIAGVVVLFVGLIFLLQSATAGAALGLVAAGLEQQAIWLAPLIIGLVVAIAGAVAAKKGLATLKRESLVPEKTVSSLKQDKQWIQNKVS